VNANATTETRLLRPSEVCARLGISKATFYRAVERGDLPALRVLGQIRVDENELREWLYGDEDAA
jgi:excisionase family DNA binding protein